MKIKYICIWDKNKNKSWSGTTYSLYKAISRKILVEDSGFKLNIIEKVVIKLFGLNISFKGINFQNRLNKMSVMIPSVHAKFNSNVNPNSDSEIILQIGDIEKFNTPYYIYQDLNIDSLLYIKHNNPQAFQFSNYQDITESSLCIRKEWEKNIYNNAAGIFTMSKWLAEYLTNHSGISKNKVHHVGGGINIDVKKINPVKKNNNKILFVGRDFRRKAGYLVYDAFKILKEKYLSSAELYVIGPSDNPFDSVDKGVKFIGDISTDELSEYFNECDIFCMPSYFEAYGLVFIEALAYGLPCIGRNDFAMKEFIKDGNNGYLIENSDAVELAEKMYKLLNNEAIKNNVRTNRENYISQFSWDTVAERIIKVVEADKDNNLK